MDQFVTNIEIYKMIADEAHQTMVKLMKAGRCKKPDGKDGWIITYDPHRNSFKQAMISIVFTGMWLEAFFHLAIAERLGAAGFKEYDFKPYEAKLELLGFTDKKLLERVSRFRKTRKSLVHEKAHFDDLEISAAQDEAENAHEILSAIHKRFSQRQWKS